MRSGFLVRSAAIGENDSNETVVSPLRAVCLHRRASHVGGGCRSGARHQQRVGGGHYCGGGLWEDFAAMEDFAANTVFN